MSPPMSSMPDGKNILKTTRSKRKLAELEVRVCVDSVCAPFNLTIKQALRVQSLSHCSQCSGK